MQDEYDYEDDGATYRAPEACPLCKGELRPVQVSYSERINGPVVRVHVAGRIFARKTYVETLACRGCGHLLSFMTNPEIMAEPPVKTRRGRKE